MKTKLLALTLTLLLLTSSLLACAPDPKSGNAGTSDSSTVHIEPPPPLTSETDAPETDVPQTDAPETDAPETDAPVTETDVEPEPKPEPEPVPAPDISTYGEAYSQTGTALDLVVSWLLEPNGDGTYAANVTLSAQSRSLFAGERANTVITVGKTTKVLTTASVSKEDNALERTPLASATFTLTAEEAQNGADLHARWYFGGTYSGVELDWIEVTDTVRHEGWLA